MRIGIDTTIMHVNPAGPGKYVRSLLEAHRLLPAPPQISTYSAGLNSVLSAGGPVGRQAHALWRDLVWTHALLPVAVRRSKVDLLHMPAYSIPAIRTTPTVVTMFDMSVLDRPQDSKTWQRLYLGAMIPFAARHADRIITISEFSRQRIHELTGEPLTKITVTSLAAGGEFKRLEAGSRTDQLIEEHGRFILAVGTLEPRKNLISLLHAVNHLKRSAVRVRVLLAGLRGWKYEPILRAVEQLELGEQVRFLDYVSDSELVRLYNAASALVFPSFYEGFGLPLIEAMACGCPVITSNRTAMPEVVGDAAILIDPENPEELADAIARMLSDRELAAEMSAKGFERAAQFSWEKCARQTVEVYRSVLGG
jgi:glycosyltransferase involved in cell wall biosynthesis